MTLFHATQISDMWAPPPSPSPMYVVFMCAALSFFDLILNPPPPPPPPDKGKGTRNMAKVGVFRVVDAQESPDITLS